MRILVCGGRDFTDTAYARRVLDHLRKRTGFDVLIEGDARGADRIAGYWARKNRITNLKYPADWTTYGRAAGSIRNEQMLREGKPDLVLAFPGNRGTNDMVQKALAAGVEVLRADPPHLPNPHSRRQR